MKLISYLQSEFALSRRKITDLIDQGLIFLNGNNVTSYKQDIRNDDKLEILSGVFGGIDNKSKMKEFFVKISEEKCTSQIVIFNKPLGYVVSKSDPNNKTIYEILPKEFKNYYYIGRLDKDSHGLLLLTNETKLVNQYEHPKNQIEKEYIVQIDSFLKKADINKCLTGIYDGGEILKIKNIEIIEGEKSKYRIILTEGKKRHIRRIFKSLGYCVIDLQRIREGDYKLGNLAIGKWKISI